jgi:hypothetical protein
MTNVSNFLSRYRLISSALVLVCMLAALTFSTQKSRAECDLQCGQGCVEWTPHGCSNCQYCCACGDDYHCDRIADGQCPCTGGLCEIQ